MALQPGDLVADKYRIERLLGEGGMGAVYVAQNERLHKRVALKVLSDALCTTPDAAARFVREAIAASRVKHPGIVEIFDCDVHDGMPWMAMELLEGETLGARIERGPLPVGETIDIALEALSAIAAVHAAGIVHRDLKPDNLFLEQLPGGGRRVKVLDFGIAKIVGHDLGTETKTGMAMGTPHFLAPEQATNAKAIDVRADVYAMGAILFHALTGQLPYEATSFGDLIRQMYTGGPRQLLSVAPHVPAAIAGVVERCLSVDPAARPESAAALSSELQSAGAGARAAGVAPTVAMSAVTSQQALQSSSASADGAQPTPSTQGSPMPPTQQMQAGAPMPPTQQMQAGALMPPTQQMPSGAQWVPATVAVDPSQPAVLAAAPAFVQPARSGPRSALVVGAVLALLLAGGAIAAVAALVAPDSGDPIAGDGAPSPTPAAAPAQPEPVDEVFDPTAPIRSVTTLALPGADATRVRVEVPVTAPRRGPDDALVTLVMFSDYECTYCSLLESTIAQLLQAYGADLRVVWRDNPLLARHPNAMPAALLAREAYAQGGNDRFWQMHDILMQNQRALSRPDLEGYAPRIGLDMARVRAALDGQTHRGLIEADTAAARQAGARGTPDTFINGRSLAGARPYEQFDAIVREEMALARALMEAGVPRRRMYEAFMQDAPDGPPPRTPPALPLVPSAPPAAPAPSAPARTNARAAGPARQTAQVERYRIEGSPAADGCGGRIVIAARHITLDRQRGTLFADVVNRTYRTRIEGERLRAWGTFDAPTACAGGVDESYDLRWVQPNVLSGTIRSSWRIRPSCEACTVTFQVRLVRVP